MRTHLVGLSLCLLVASTALGQDGAIQGTVVDEEGAPVVGADVSTMWLEGRPGGGVTTDKEGRFILVPRRSSRAVGVLVMDQERKRGVVTRYDPGSFDEKRTLTLKKLTRVHGTYSSTDLGIAPTWTNCYVNYSQIRIGRCQSREAEFSFHLPPGDYHLRMYGSDVMDRNENVTVGNDGGELDLGVIDLKATAIAKMYGKRPPRLTVTDAIGIDKRIQLADLKGKYVILEFWQYG